MRISKKLCTLVAILAAGVAQAGYYSPTTITNNGEMQLGTQATEGKYTIDAKDGADNATITQSVVSGSALYVREGTVTISGTTESPTVVKLNTSANVPNTPGDSPTVLNVAGKNGTLVIDNATVTTDKKAATSVGGPDGNGTLIIQNGGVYDGSNQNYFYIGYKGYTGEGETPKKQQVIHATTQNIGDSTSDLANRYQGSYTTGADGTEYGRAVVTVTGNSTLITGGSNREVSLEFCMGEGEVNILDNSTWSTSARPVCIGYVPGSTSVVNVKDGSVWNVNGNLQTGSFAGYNTKTEINVENATVNLNYAGGSTIGVGDYNEKTEEFFDNGSTTSMNLTKGAKLNMVSVFEIGWSADASLSIDETSSIESVTDSEALLLVCGAGSVTNEGTIGVTTQVDGGSLTLDGGMMADLLMTDGTITVNGYVETGDLTLTGGNLIFNEGALINLNGSDLVVDGATITLVLNEGSELADNYTLFVNSGNVSTVEVNVVNAQGESLGSVKTEAIPEPTTATLSLLALAALAARRRRKA